MKADCQVRLCNIEEYAAHLLEIIEAERIDIPKMHFLLKFEKAYEQFLAD